jgi:hypothetical protein
MGERVNWETSCFTHKDVAEIFEELDKKVAVCVSRGDGPSSQITGPVLQREFFGK